MPVCCSYRFVFGWIFVGLLGLFVYISDNSYIYNANLLSFASKMNMTQVFDGLLEYFWMDVVSPYCVFIIRVYYGVSIIIFTNDLICQTWRQKCLYNQVYDWLWNVYG